MEPAKMEPKEVFRFFEEISRIPRPSHHEEKISDYLADFARERGLYCEQDELHNIIIIKEASPGYEEEPPMILQGHMDMVCEQEAGCEKDMQTEGLDLVAEGDFLSARGTTLGGDDGIAVAYALAILDREDLPHPRLEFVCTVCEEVGMEGATGLDVSCLKGKRLLNLDSEEEGSFLAGCAGGCTMELHVPVEREAVKGQVLRLEISGLKGGHSGTEIDQGRANANRLMLQWLKALHEKVPFRLVSLEGGSKDNAIPRSCACRILLPEETTAASAAAAAALEGENIAGEWEQAEQDLRLACSAEEIRTDSGALGAGETGELLTRLLSLPNGVIAMCQEPEGLVETSLNLGVLKLEEQGLLLRYSLRSCVDRQLDLLLEQMEQKAKEMGALTKTSGRYPAWEYQKASPFREKLIGIYEDMYRRTPEVAVIHAGVECGILAAKIPGLECVSIGPDILDIHTPAERLSISSAKRTYEFILRVLARKDQE